MGAQGVQGPPLHVLMEETLSDDVSNLFGSAPDLGGDLRGADPPSYGMASRILQISASGHRRCLFSLSSVTMAHPLF